MSPVTTSARIFRTAEGEGGIGGGAAAPGSGEGEGDRFSRACRDYASANSGKHTVVACGAALALLSRFQGVPGECCTQRGGERAFSRCTRARADRHACVAGVRYHARGIRRRHNVPACFRIEEREESGRDEKSLRYLGRRASSDNSSLKRRRHDQRISDNYGESRCATYRSRSELRESAHARSCAPPFESTARRNDNREVRGAINVASPSGAWGGGREGGDRRN